MRANSLISQSTLLLTLRLLGCCRTSMACFCRSSCSRRLLYSIWLVSSVWCCVRIRSARVRCTELSCLNSSSWVDSWCRSSMAHSRSFWVCFLFRSWWRTRRRTRREERGDDLVTSQVWVEMSDKYSSSAFLYLKASEKWGKNLYITSYSCKNVQAFKQDAIVL